MFGFIILFSSEFAFTQNIFEQKTHKEIISTLNSFNKLENKESDAAIMQLKSAMLLSYKIKYLDGYLYSGFQLADIYKSKGMFKDALTTINNLMAFEKVKNNKFLTAKCLLKKGEIYRASYSLDMALTNLFSALSMFNEHNSSFGKAKCYNRISAVYFENKEMKLAELYADSSNIFAVKNNDYKLLSSNAELKGAIFRRTNKYSLAISSLEKAKEYLYLNKDTVDIPNIYNNFAYTYFEMGEINLAIQYAKQAFDIAVATDIFVYKTNSAQILAECYMTTNRIEIAFDYLRMRDSMVFVGHLADDNKLLMDMYEKLAQENNEKQVVILENKNELKDVTIKQQKYIPFHRHIFYFNWNSNIFYSQRKTFFSQAK